jgi:hypothetical protein
MKFSDFQNFRITFHKFLNQYFWQIFAIWSNCAALVPAGGGGSGGGGSGGGFFYCLWKRPAASCLTLYFFQPISRYFESIFLAHSCRLVPLCSARACRRRRFRRRGFLLSLETASCFLFNPLLLSQPTQKKGFKRDCRAWKLPEKPAQIHYGRKVLILF